MRRPAARLNAQRLEAREVPAGIVLNTTTHLLTLTGDGANDYAQVRYGSTDQVVNGAETSVEDQTVIEATVATAGGYTTTKRFAAAGVTTIAFNGKGGQDVFLNSTNRPSTTTTSAGGTVSGSVLQGSPTNNNAADQANLGVFVVGASGAVSADYLYCGAGYRAQLGFYNLAGMDAYTPGSADYIKEAARRALSNSTDGAIVIDHHVEGAKFAANLPWEGMLNSGPYLGPKAVALAPGGRYGAVIVPNGYFQDVFNNPSVGGDKRPLFSIPSANPYAVTPQTLGQMGDMMGTGTTFAFEDLRLDGSSDRDYNDLVFQVTGARATAAPISQVVNSSRDFTMTAIGQTLQSYALSQQAADPSLNGGFTAGTFVVGATGKVGVDYLFDGGGYVGQVGVFSLQGMGQYAPGSADFIKEATRRVLSNSNLGGLVIDDYPAGARYGTSTDAPLKSFNQGVYQGIKTVNMTPGDVVGFVLVPNATAWEVFSNPTLGGGKRALFSMPAANPGGAAQLARADADGNVLAFEDVPTDGSGAMASDRDFNDIVFRVYGLTSAALPPNLGDVAATGKDWRQVPLGIDLTTYSTQPWN